MLDTVSTISGLTSDLQPVMIESRRLPGLWQIAGWDGFETAANAHLSGLGLTLPASCNVSQRRDGGTLWRIAPDRALLCSGSTPPAPQGDLVQLDLSYSRILLRISGEGAAGLLSRVLPLDFSLDAFPLDSFAQSGIHGVAVLVDRVGDDTFDVLVPGTWSVSVTEYLQLHLVY